MIEFLRYVGDWTAKKERGGSSRGGIEPLACHILCKKLTHVPQGTKMKKRFLAEWRNMNVKGEMFVDYDTKGCDLINDWRGGNVNTGDIRKWQ